MKAKLRLHQMVSLLVICNPVLSLRFAYAYNIHSIGQGQGQAGQAGEAQGGAVHGQWPSPYTYMGSSPSTSGRRATRLEPVPNAALSVTPLLSSAPAPAPAPARKSGGQKHQQQQQRSEQNQQQMHGNEHVYGHNAQGLSVLLGRPLHGGHDHVGMGMHVVPSTASPAQASPIHGQGAHDFVYGGYGSGGQGGGGHAPGGTSSEYLSPVSALVSVDVHGLQQHQHQQHYGESSTASAGYADAHDRMVYHDEASSHGGFSHAFAQAEQWAAARGGNPSQHQHQHQQQHQQRGAYPGY